MPATIPPAACLLPSPSPCQVTRLPNDVNQVRRKLTISANKPHLFGLGLGNQQTIKRIMMMQGELP
jgi:hypothetical protein